MVGKYSINLGVMSMGMFHPTIDDYYLTVLRKKECDQAIRRSAVASLVIRPLINRPVSAALMA